MFHCIPQPMLDRMAYLEQIDRQDRTDGTPRAKRLRQIPREVGQFIALLAASAPEGAYIEIGTSAGYSTLWLALACKHPGRKITTFEVSLDKARLARETFTSTGVADIVEFVVGDARDYLKHYSRVAFCFLDAEKEVYGDCYEAVVSNLVSGGLFVADNATNHYQTLKRMLDRALSDERVDALIVRIGNGELVCRKL